MRSSTLGELLIINSYSPFSASKKNRTIIMTHPLIRFNVKKPDTQTQLKIEMLENKKQQLKEKIKLIEEEVKRLNNFTE